ncbi:uncharacterized protein PRCAT00003495001 [Priceomyces carsonii]|uniref:uncharacterized protein n=1 Tax=Priceomyces carsonii TaxID=28549 RepID=UPI002EDA336C|nr:unnamed protein product [Priceomyces carsonii]
MSVSTKPMTNLRCLKNIFERYMHINVQSDIQLSYNNSSEGPVISRLHHGDSVDQINYLCHSPSVSSIFLNQSILLMQDTMLINDIMTVYKELKGNDGRLEIQA